MLDDIDVVDLCNIVIEINENNDILSEETEFKKKDKLAEKLDNCLHNGEDAICDEMINYSSQKKCDSGMLITPPIEHGDAG